MSSTPGAEPPDEPDIGERQSLQAVHTLDLGESVGELARARAWARSVLGGQEDGQVTDVLLMLDVLVADAFERGDTVRQIRLQIASAASRLWLEVDTRCARAGPAETTSTDLAGRSLLEQLTADWGASRDGDRQTHWAVVDLAT